MFGEIFAANYSYLIKFLVVDKLDIGVKNCTI